MDWKEVRWNAAPIATNGIRRALVFRVQADPGNGEYKKNGSRLASTKSRRSTHACPTHCRRHEDGSKETFFSSFASDQRSIASRDRACPSQPIVSIERRRLPSEKRNASNSIVNETLDEETHFRSQLNSFHEVSIGSQQIAVRARSCTAKHRIWTKTRAQSDQQERVRLDGLRAARRKRNVPSCCILPSLSFTTHQTQINEKKANDGIDAIHAW